MQRWLLLLLLASALAAFGGTYSFTTVPILLGALLVALSDWRRTFSFPKSNRLLDVALCATTGAILVQLIPLPAAVVAFLSPDATRVRAALRLDAALLDGRAIPLSIDPRASLEALLVFISAVLVFWSARAAFSTGGVRRFIRVLAVIGMAVAIEAIIQRALSPDLIYGYWRTERGAHPFGPFVNRNHFAAWLLMALPLVAGYLAARVRIRIADARATNVFHVLAVAGAPLLITLASMLAAISASFSRSAVLGLGAATVTSWFMARKRIEVAPRLTMPLLGAAGLALFFGVMFVDLDQWAARLSSTFTSTETPRWTIWRESAAVFRDFWLTGTGAGAYSMAMLFYQKVLIPMPHMRAFAHINQAHSHYIQVAVEGGLLLGAPVLLALAALVRAGRSALATDHGEAMWMRVGAAAGLVGIATQSVWETPLRMTANAVLCAALAGVLVHRRDRDTGYS